MNAAKTKEQKECFDSLEVAVKSVNQSLNDVNFSVSVLKGFVRESVEGITDRVRFEPLTSQNLIQDLSEKFDKLSIAPKEKEIPKSMLSTHQIPIQHPKAPIEKFVLFPKE